MKWRRAVRSGKSHEHTLTPSPGTISISGTTITGIGTVFTAYKMGALIFVKDIGLVGHLASDPTGDLSATLVVAWAGSAVSGKAFSAYMQGDLATYSKRIRDLLNNLAVPKTGQNMIFDGSGITAIDPGAGKVRFNSASNPTAAYVSYTDADGNDITNLVKALDDVANAVSRSSLTFRPTDGANAFADLNVTGTITDNTTYATVPVSLRAGTVPANLATLAMAGVPSGKDGGAINGAETIKTSGWTFGASDSGGTFIANSATGITAAFAAVATLGSTWMVLVKNIGAGVLTLDPNGSETIDGATTLTLGQNQSAIVSCNGSLLRSEAFSFGSTPATARFGMAAFGVVRTQVFTSSGTYTPNANMLYCIIEVLGGGGGGGGGGGLTTTASTVYVAGGGAAGSYSRHLATASDIGASKAETIGALGAGATGNTTGAAGGTSSVGSLCTAPGGNGGANGSTGQGGSSGGPGTGNIIAAGGMPGVGGSTVFSGPLGVGANGGSSQFGGGGIGSAAAGGANNGGAASGKGAGGGGAGGASGTVTANGGAGTAGLVIITEFCSQ